MSPHKRAQDFAPVEKEDGSNAAIRVDQLDDLGTPMGPAAKVNRGSGQLIRSYGRLSLWQIGASGQEEPRLCVVGELGASYS